MTMEFDMIINPHFVALNLYKEFRGWIYEKNITYPKLGVTLVCPWSRTNSTAFMDDFYLPFYRCKQYIYDYTV